MSFLEIYWKNKTNSNLISKFTINSLKNYPELKCFVFFFIVNARSYKKNLLLFYLVINLIFGGASFFYKSFVGCLVVLKIKIKKIKMLIFLHKFINNYLPLSHSIENIYKKTVWNRKNSYKNLLFYRFHYFSFPALSELDLFYEEFDLIYTFVTEFKFQLDVVVKNQFLFINSGECLLRMNRFPCLSKN